MLDRDVLIDVANCTRTDVEPDGRLTDCETDPVCVVVVDAGVVVTCSHDPEPVT